MAPPGGLLYGDAMASPEDVQAEAVDAPAFHLSPLRQTEREAVMTLLQVQGDLQHMLQQNPRTAVERRAWRAGVSELMIEIARGRLYLSRLRRRAARAGSVDSDSQDGRQQLAS